MDVAEVAFYILIHVTGVAKRIRTLSLSTGRGEEDTTVCEVTPKEKSSVWFPLRTFLKVLV